jgi:hypothetical protein
MKSLHLHIDRIVVEGLPESGQRRFMRALEAQLHELADGGIADAFTRNTRKRIQALNAGQLRAGATPEQAAAQVVRSIRQGVFTNGQAVSAARSSIASSARMEASGGEARHNV